MIERRTFLILVIALVLFGGSAWAAFRYHRTFGAQQQLAQPGWCCNSDTRSCDVSDGNDACRAKGGTTFNWDKDTCANICSQSKPKRVPKVQRTPNAASAPAAAK